MLRAMPMLQAKPGLLIILLPLERSKQQHTIHPPACRRATAAQTESSLSWTPRISGLVYSTYFGGNSGDGITAIAVDSTGNAYVTGDFRSTDIPITPGAFSSTPLGGYVAKLNAAGSAVVWGTRLGIAGADSKRAAVLLLMRPETS